MILSLVNHKRVGQGVVGRNAIVRVRVRRLRAAQPAHIVIEALDSAGNPDANPAVTPDGQGTLMIRARVTDSSDAPINNHRVRFEVEARAPNVEVGRSRRRTHALTPRQRNNRAQARRALRQAYIATGATAAVANQVSRRFRPRGTLNTARARTTNNGTVTVTYRAPHVGGNQGQPAVDMVKVSSVSNPQLTAECIIELRYNLVEVTAQWLGFRIVGAFGTYATADVRDNIIEAGEAWFNAVSDAIENVPGSNRALARRDIPDEFTVTALNLRHGGVYPPHVTHRIGVHMDLRPVNSGGRAGVWYMPQDRGRGRRRRRVNRNYRRAATRALVDILRQNGARRILFNDPQIPNVNFAPGHDDHLHVEF